MTHLRLWLLAILLVSAAPGALAQGCSMCGAQTNSGESTRLTKYRGQGLNTGILYLAAVPYLAASALGLVWYRNRRRTRQQQPTTKH
jgi:hypothetical protein